MHAGMETRDLMRLVRVFKSSATILYARGQPAFFPRPYDVPCFLSSQLAEGIRSCRRNVASQGSERESLISKERRNHGEALSAQVFSEPSRRNGPAISFPSRTMIYASAPSTLSQRSVARPAAIDAGEALLCIPCGPTATSA